MASGAVHLMGNFAPTEDSFTHTHILVALYTRMHTCELQLEFIVYAYIYISV